MSPRLYVYKLTHDHGAAPCVDGFLSLAICKPGIRTTAHAGDVLFGFAADSLNPDNRLIYIARVTRVEDDGDYYEKATYEHRGDRIYIRGDDGRFRLRGDARYHADGDDDHILKDLGSPPEYERARVLISDDFRYFGSARRSRTVDLSPYPHLQRLLRTGGCRPYRVKHPPERAVELRQLLASAWSDHAAQIVGSPSSPGRCMASPVGRNSRTSPRGCG
jgi:Nucleotide modification associated domain 2